jgi:23S rRNA (uracil1939-C5)-methyltransferase
MTAERGTLSITHLGAHGDGVAETDGDSVYVPFALPGERVRIGADGALVVLSPNPRRRQPLCRHFGVCGGCLAQHMDEELYGQWKRDILLAAFRQRGLEPEVLSMRRIVPGSRRRAVLTARCTQGETVLGYHQRRSAGIFAIAECPVLAPAIVAELDGLRAIAATLAAREARLTVLATPRGLDVAVADDSGRGDGPTLAALARLASQHAIARLVRNEELIAERARPELMLGSVAVVPPPGVFVQAVAAAEAAMVEEVLEVVGGARHVLDLFAGIGTFTLALARRARVLAVDAEARALAALSAAANGARGLKPIATLRRDLMRVPLTAHELDAFECVVLNPPRAGALAQARQIGSARVARVVYISCNPATLARDARILVEAGFALERVLPIDQFLYSAQLEVVATFRRADRRQTPGRRR